MKKKKKKNQEIVLNQYLFIIPRTNACLVPRICISFVSGYTCTYYANIVRYANEQKW